jgi:hypothetical protein
MTVAMAMVGARQRRLVRSYPSPGLAARLVEARPDAPARHQTERHAGRLNRPPSRPVMLVLALMLGSAAVLLGGAVLLVGFLKYVGIAGDFHPGASAVLPVMVASMTAVLPVMHMRAVIASRMFQGTIDALVMMIWLVMMLCHDGGSFKPAERRRERRY